MRGHCEVDVAGRTRPVDAVTARQSRRSAAARGAVAQRPERAVRGTAEVLTLSDAGPRSEPVDDGRRPPSKDGTVDA